MGLCLWLAGFRSLFSHSTRGPSELVSELSLLVQRLPVAPNVKKALTKDLQAVQVAIDAQDGAAACAELQDFIAQVLAFRKNKKLSPEQAAQLISEANEIGALLGC